MQAVDQKQAISVALFWKMPPFALTHCITYILTSSLHGVCCSSSTRIWKFFYRVSYKQPFPGTWLPFCHFRSVVEWLCRWLLAGTVQNWCCCCPSHLLFGCSLFCTFLRCTDIQMRSDNNITLYISISCDFYSRISLLWCWSQCMRG